MSGFVHEDLPTAEVDRREALKRPLADAVRDLAHRSMIHPGHAQQVPAVR